MAPSTIEGILFFAAITLAAVTVASGFGRSFYSHFRHRSGSRADSAILPLFDWQKIFQPWRRTRLGAILVSALLGIIVFYFRARSGNVQSNAPEIFSSEHVSIFIGMMVFIASASLSITVILMNRAQAVQDDIVLSVKSEIRDLEALGDDLCGKYFSVPEYYNATFELDSMTLSDVSVMPLNYEHYMSSLLYLLNYIDNDQYQNDPSAFRFLKTCQRLEKIFNRALMSHIRAVVVANIWWKLTESFFVLLLLMSGIFMTKLLFQFPFDAVLLDGFFICTLAFTAFSILNFLSYVSQEMSELTDPHGSKDPTNIEVDQIE